MALIVPANSSFVSAELGLRPERMFVLVWRGFVSFLFFSFLLLSFLPFFLSSFSGVRVDYTVGYPRDYTVDCTMDMFLVLFRCKLYGLVYYSSLVPFPCVLVLR